MTNTTSLSRAVQAWQNKNTQMWVFAYWCYRHWLLEENSSHEIAEQIGRSVDTVRRAANTYVFYRSLMYWYTQNDEYPNPRDIRRFPHIEYTHFMRMMEAVNLYKIPEPEVLAQLLVVSENKVTAEALRDRIDEEYGGKDVGAKYLKKFKSQFYYLLSKAEFIDSKIVAWLEEGKELFS